MIDRDHVESAQRIVSMLTVEQIHNTLENLAATGAAEELGPEYVAFVRGMLWRRLESFRRGRRGLTGVPTLPASFPTPP